MNSLESKKSHSCLEDKLVFPGESEFDKQPDLCVHIRIQQRNRGKCLTLVEGLDEKWNPNPQQMLKYLRKTLATNGTLLKSDNGPDKILQLQGDHRQKVRDFLVSNKLCELDQIKIHGGST